jgi:hypothetical protein
VILARLGNRNHRGVLPYLRKITYLNTRIEHISQINEPPTRHILENNVQNTVKPRSLATLQSLTSFSDLPQRSKGRRICVEPVVEPDRTVLPENGIQ